MLFKPLLKGLIPLSILLSLTLLNTQKASGSTDDPLVISKDKFRRSTSGYINDASNFVGEKLALKITCPTEKFSITAIRIGFYNGNEGKTIDNIKDLKCKNQINKIASKWQVAASINTANYPHGMYLFKIEDDQKFASFIPVILREKDSKAKAIFSIPIMTMQAYNTWSGADTYGTDGDFDKRLRSVDFRQPYDKYFGTGKYLRYVHPLVVLVEKMKLDVEYIADTDLHFEHDLLDNRQVFISAGHDEYWTLDERNRVLSARKSGTNTLFFGANVGYWITRLDKTLTDNSIRMEIYKSAKEDPNKVNPTVRFRDIVKSESELTGLEYKCFPAKGEMKIKSPNSFIFEGIKNPDTLNLNEIVGPEIDTLKRDNYFNGKIINLAESRVKCGNKWYLPKYATMNMILGYSLNGEGGLFSTGTMGWVTIGLRSSEQSDVGILTRVVTKNILLNAIKGPIEVN
jgi:hypothetical protein